MTPPVKPSRSIEILTWAEQAWRWMLATKPIAGPGLQSRETPNGTIISVAPRGAPGAASQISPFRLTVAKEAEDWKWQVAQNQSSVQDGTNGDAIDLGPGGLDWKSGAIEFGVAEMIDATKYIVLECTVDPDDLTLSDWTLAAVDEADADEIATGGSPVAQTKAKLLIGKITYTAASGGDPAAAVASQAVFSPQRIVHGYVNGLFVRIFDSAPIHYDNL